MTISDEEYGRYARAYAKRYNRIRYRASAELIRAHPEEFDELMAKYDAADEEPPVRKS